MFWPVEQQQFEALHRLRRVARCQLSVELQLVQTEPQLVEAPALRDELIVPRQVTQRITGPFLTCVSSEQCCLPGIGVEHSTRLANEVFAAPQVDLIFIDVEHVAGRLRVERPTGPAERSAESGDVCL